MSDARSVNVGQWVEEAVASLGYLKPGVVEKLTRLIEDEFAQPLQRHPRELATQVRKQGQQLSRDEKKGLGIRANAFMSREALADLTDKGLSSPLAAHEQTVL